MKLVYGNAAILATALLLSACDKPVETKEPQVGVGATATAAPEPAPEAQGPDCRDPIKPFFAALPKDKQVLGQAETGRECSRTSSARLIYGTGEPVSVTYEFSTFKYEDSDLIGAMSEAEGRKLMETTRKGAVAGIEMQKSILKTAQATAGDPSVDVMSAEERARLPREVVLDGNRPALVYYEGAWKLAAANGEHFLTLEVGGAQEPWANTDQAAPALVALANKVDLSKL